MIFIGKPFLPTTTKSCHKLFLDCFVLIKQTIWIHYRQQGKIVLSINGCLSCPVLQYIDS